MNVYYFEESWSAELEYLLLIIVVIRWDKSHPGDLNNTHIHESE